MLIFQNVMPGGVVPPLGGAVPHPGGCGPPPWGDTFRTPGGYFPDTGGILYGHPASQGGYSPDTPPARGDTFRTPGRCFIIFSENSVSSTRNVHFPKRHARGCGPPPWGVR